jgi:hypothetical protein
VTEIVLQGYGGALDRWYPVLHETIKHAETSSDPEILQLTLFFAMSAIPSMQRWAEPRLPPGRRDVFFYELESLAKDLACREIDVATYLREMYMVVMIGKRVGSVRLPHPRHLDEWQSEFRDGDRPDPRLVDGAALDAVLAMRMDGEGDDGFGQGRPEGGKPKRRRKKTPGV